MNIISYFASFHEKNLEIRETKNIFSDQGCKEFAVNLIEDIQKTAIFEILKLEKRMLCYMISIGLLLFLKHMFKMGLILLNAFDSGS